MWYRLHQCNSPESADQRADTLYSKSRCTPLWLTECRHLWEYKSFANIIYVILVSPNCNRKNNIHILGNNYVISVLKIPKIAWFISCYVSFLHSLHNLVGVAKGGIERTYNGQQYTCAPFIINLDVRIRAHTKWYYWFTADVSIAIDDIWLAEIVTSINPDYFVIFWRIRSDSAQTYQDSKDSNCLPNGQQEQRENRAECFLVKKQRNSTSLKWMKSNIRYLAFNYCDN